MPLNPGSRLGPYVIGAPLGAGGMGEVYRARDSTLQRDVALKILPELFALDSDRLARFRSEAQVLASLNHPNIAAIYGFDESTAVHALVLELVEGPTLADRIAQGPIAVDEALLIARQVAEALEAAHEHGVIHRDLKPANIKLRPDGTAIPDNHRVRRSLATDDPSELAVRAEAAVAAQSRRHAAGLRVQRRAGRGTAEPDPRDVVHQPRLAADGAQTRVDLTAVVGRVAGDLKDRLRQRRLRGRKSELLRQRVRPWHHHRPGERRFVEAVEERRGLGVVRNRPCLDGGHIRELRQFGKRQRPLAPEVEKRALHGVQVQQQFAQRLVGAGRGRREHGPPHFAVGPLHVPEQILQVDYSIDCLPIID